MSRPGSPQERAPYFDDAYCAVCKCSHCQYLSSSSCPKCTCASCIDQPEAAYDPADDDQKPARKVAKSRGGRSAVFDTPKKRAKTASQTPTDSRNLAIEAAKSAAPYTMPPGVSRCCLVSLRYAEADCLQTCHILPRSLQPEILTALERAWNLPSQTLNIHSRYNMITLTPELHASFDKGSWALVPLSTHLLYRFLNYKHPITRLYKKGQTFEYILLPLPVARKGLTSTLIRRNETTWTELPSAETPDTLHYFPYDTLPILKSHIYPHYAVYDLGKKLRASGVDIEQLEQENFGPPFPDNSEPLFQTHTFLWTALFASYDNYLRWIKVDPTISSNDVSPDGLDKDADPNGGGPGGSSGGPGGPSGRYPFRATTLARRQGSTASGGSGPGGSAGGRLADDGLDHTLNSTPGIEKCDDVEDDEEYDAEESDSSFFQRLNNWVDTVIPGLEPPTPDCDDGSQVQLADFPTLPCDSGVQSESITVTVESDILSDNGSATTFVGAHDENLFLKGVDHSAEPSEAVVLPIVG